MGLDMYLEGKKYFWDNWQEPSANRTEDGFEVKEVTLRLGYWRKHPNLHGFIVNAFAGGKDDCQEIALSVENLQTIIDAVKEQSLPNTTGFFFGKSEGSEEERAEDIKILEGAIAWLQGGDKEPVEIGETIAMGGGGMTMMEIKPRKQKARGQSISRQVVYRASW